MPTKSSLARSARASKSAPRKPATKKAGGASAEDQRFRTDVERYIHALPPPSPRDESSLVEDDGAVLGLQCLLQAARALATARRQRQPRDIDEAARKLSTCAAFMQRLNGGDVLPSLDDFVATFELVELLVAASYGWSEGVFAEVRRATTAAGDDPVPTQQAEILALIRNAIGELRAGRPSTKQQMEWSKRSHEPIVPAQEYWAESIALELEDYGGRFSRVSKASLLDLLARAAAGDVEAPWVTAAIQLEARAWGARVRSGESLASARDRVAKSIRQAERRAAPRA